MKGNLPMRQRSRTCQCPKYNLARLGIRWTLGRFPIPILPLARYYRRLSE
jgi:hypothetical protein